MKKMLGMALGYILFSFIGVPMAIAGMIVGSDGLKTAWIRSATAFGRAMNGEVPVVAVPGFAARTDCQQIQRDDYEPSDACKQAFIGDHLLDVYLHDQRIERILKAPTDPLPWQRASAGSAFVRVPLKPLAADQLRKQGLEFTLDSAIAFTRTEFEKGRIDRACARGTAVREETSASCKHLYLPEAQPQGAVQEAATEEAASTPIKTASGEVTFAGNNRVTPKGKPSYETFTVIVKDERGQSITFSGVDLKEKFEANAFHVGQQVRIEQRSVEFSMEIGAKTVKQRKNVYDVTVIG